MVDETNEPATKHIILKIVNFLVTTVLTGGSSSRESCLVTNLSPPQFNQLKVTLAMKYLLLFSIVMSLYIKRNPHIQSICWQDMRIEFQGGDSSHEIFFYFSFCSSPLRYLNCRFDAEAKGQSISKCLFGVFNFFKKK